MRLRSYGGTTFLSLSGGGNENRMYVQVCLYIPNPSTSRILHQHKQVTLDMRDRREKEEKVRMVTHSDTEKGEIISPFATYPAKEYLKNNKPTRGSREKPINHNIED